MYTIEEIQFTFNEVHFPANAWGSLDPGRHISPVTEGDGVSLMELGGGTPAQADRVLCTIFPLSHLHSPTPTALDVDRHIHSISQEKNQIVRLRHH